VTSALTGRKAVLAKLGMDAHWRGVMVVANALRDAGMEVVYIGHATATELVAAVVEEDPALVGASTLSGNHLVECEHIATTLREGGFDEVVLVAGGAIPPADVPSLRAMGFDAVFPTGSSLQSMVEKVNGLVAVREALRHER